MEQAFVFPPEGTFSPTFSTAQFPRASSQQISPLVSTDVENEPPLSEQHSPTPTTIDKSSKSPTSPITANPLPPPPGLNPRSCVSCRKRKVRCDKNYPCSKCQKASIECIFPRPGRAPRRSKKPPDTELLDRLRRLEGVIQSLGKGTDEEKTSPGAVEAKGSNEPEKPCQSPPSEPVHKAAEPACPTADTAIRSICPKKAKKVDDGSTLHVEMGQLVVEDGRSRYVSNKLWAGLAGEIAEMRDILDDPTDEEVDDLPSPDTNSSSTSGQIVNHQSFLFGYSSTMISLRNLHPPAHLIPKFWHVYKENVDPMVRMLHRPTTEVLMHNASRNLDNLPKSVEALMFAIYFAAATSLSPEQCLDVLGQDKETILKEYRFGAEQALAKAQFIQTQELMVLQAFTLFLVSVRRHDESRFVWTMAGLVTRLANAMGLHRDGTQFSVNPFETELRRRLWWLICTLDVRAAEDQGTDPTITEQAFDTKLPLNINDEDMWPDMKESPKEREGCTEMTFDLIRYEISNTIRFFTFAPLGRKCGHKIDKISIEDKERMIERLRAYLEDKYLKHCDLNIPIQWVAVNVSRLILNKMWLIVHHPFRRPDKGAGIPKETKDRLFSTSVDVIRYSRILESQQNTMKWGWLFRTYVQWHAVAYLLAELSIRTLGPEVDDAWQVVNSVFEEWDGTVAEHKKGMLWKPIRKLMIKAKGARARALEKASRYPTDGSLGPAPDAAAAAVAPQNLVNSQSQSPVNGEPRYTPILLHPLYARATPTDLLSTPASADFVPLGSEPFGDIALAGLNGAAGVGSSPMDQWRLDGLTLLPDSDLVGGEDLALSAMNDGEMNWEGWDEMVKDYQMEVGQDNTVALSVGGWW